MNAHLHYLSYVLRHKWHVFVACCALGIPWRGVVHDLSKFSRAEWGPYVRMFYGGPYRSWKEANGSYREWLLSVGNTKEQVQEAFDRAWLHHQHANDHHWQAHVLREDSGDTKVLPMSDAQRREMVSDWRGAGRALGFPDTAAWYAKNRDNIMLHPDTRVWVEAELGVR